MNEVPYWMINEIRQALWFIAFAVSIQLGPFHVKIDKDDKND